MSISNQTNQVYGLCDGVTTTFSFPFKIFFATDIQVYLVNTPASPPTSTLQAITTDYTVTFNSAVEGGSITFVTPPPSGYTWFIERIEPFTQSVVIPTEGALPALQISNQLDLVVMLCIQMNQAIKQCIQVSSPFLSANTLTLPSPAAGNVFGWDPTGTFIENIPINNGGQVIPSGMLKGSGGTIVSAVSGTDYCRPTFANVLDFGAVGNGVNDCTSAIQAAINSLSPLGGEVYFPPGNYVTSADINISAFPVSIIGAGPNVCTIKVSNATQNGLNFSGGGSGSLVRDIQISSTGVTKTAGAGILLNGVGSTLIENVQISYQYIGISLVNSNQVQFRDILIQYLTVGTGIGVIINGGIEQRFSSMFIEGQSGGDANIGVQVLNSGGALFFEQIEVSFCATGIALAPTGTNQVNDVFMSHCVVDSCSGTGLLINPSSSAAVMYVHSVDDWFCSNGGYGVEIEGAGVVVDIRFTAARIINNGGHGVLIVAGQSISLVNCFVSQNGINTANTYNGINVNGGVSDFSLIGNCCGPFGELTNTQLYGIFVGTGSSNQYQIIGNDCTGNITSGVFDGGSGTNKIVIGNTGSQENYIAGGLQVVSTTTPFIPPIMTTTQKNAISSPTAGMVVYDSTLNTLAVYNGSAWKAVTIS